MSLTLTYAELDVPRCKLTYGVPPCSAQLGVTGEIKCFNTPATCQVPEDYSGEIKTLRWVVNSEHVPLRALPAVPSLVAISPSPQAIEPGESLGKRERVKLTFKNHPHNDLDLDPYVGQRDYNPWERGTYWGKFNARWPNISGFSARTRRAINYDPANTNIESQLETAHYIAERLELGVDQATINCLDVLTFVEGNKALYPPPSNGLLADAITDLQPNFLLAPPGIGTQYPASGEASIEKEYVTFTRSGDYITLTGRGLYGSERKAHDAGATFQVAGVIIGNVATALQKLLEATSTPLAWYDINAWQTEAEHHAPEILHGRIAAPTEVNKLIGHLMQEMGLDIHSDLIRQKIVMRVLRKYTPTFSINDDNAKGLAPSLDTSKLVTAVYLQYGRVNPLEKVDEPQNYIGHLLRASEDPQLVLQSNAPAIRKIQSIWLPSTHRQTASETAQLILGRYGRVLRSLSCSVPMEDAPQLGDIGEVTARFFEDPTGSTAPIPMQVVQIARGVSSAQLVLQEYGINYLRPSDPTRRVTLKKDKEWNVNLRQKYIETYGTATIPPDTPVIFEADPGVVFGSKTSSFAVVAGDWPEISSGVTITIQGLIIVGHGGRGGYSVNTPEGGDGGPALHTRVPLKLVDCVVGGGGGGGGAAIHHASYGKIVYDGGGGAGEMPGVGAVMGSVYSGGKTGGSAGASGGGLGMPGRTGGGGPTQGYPGGQPGIAIDGGSFVTRIDSIVYGAEVN